MINDNFPLPVGSDISVNGKSAKILEVYPNQKYEIEYDNGEKDIISHSRIETKSDKKLDFEFAKNILSILQGEGYKITMEQLLYKVENLPESDFEDLLEAFDDGDNERVVTIVSGGIEHNVISSVMSVKNVARLILNTLEDSGISADLNEIERKIKDISDDNYITLSKAVGSQDTKTISDILGIQTSRMNNNPRKSNRNSVDFTTYKENRLPIWGKEYYAEYESLEDAEEDLGIKIKSCNQIWIGEDCHLLKESYECPEKELYINVYQDGSVTVDKGIIKKIYNKKKVRMDRRI